ncbi:hypothetical protein D9M73_77770 [compost metagenome]
MKPEELKALADRIDHEDLWRRPFFDRDTMTQEERDRLDAAVHLRRYASARGTVLEALKEGREYIRGYKFTRAGMGTDARGCGDHGWHSAINKFSDSDFYKRPVDGSNKDWPRMMYEAKQLSDEVPRMILKFESERRGLPTGFKMCGHDGRPAMPLPDNHLRCALGQECRKCPYLGAIEAAPDMTNEAKDEAKAWTCATHILRETSADAHLEEFIYDKGDVAFHARMAASYADMEAPEGQMSPPDSPEAS